MFTRGYSVNVFSYVFNQCLALSCSFPGEVFALLLYVVSSDSNLLCFLLIDYDEKAEDAVDYEDIDEQYEGPETQAVTEEDYLLPKNDYFSAEVSTATFDRTSVFDDENYDDDDDDDGDAEKIGKEQEVVNNDAEVQTTCPSGLIWIHTVFSVFVYVN